MTWTKQALIEEAHSELGLAFYNFDLDPEELQTGLRRMDAMWALWEEKGLRFSYNHPGQLNDESGLPDGAIEATICHLAIRIAPGKGKAVTPETKMRADDAYATLTRIAAFPQQQQMPSGVPLGAGNKPWRQWGRRFTSAPDTNPLQVAPSGDLDIK